MKTFMDILDIVLSAISVVMFFVGIMMLGYGIAFF